MHFQATAPAAVSCCGVNEGTLPRTHQAILSIRPRSPIERREVPANSGSRACDRSQDRWTIGANVFTFSSLTTRVRRKCHVDRNDPAHHLVILLLGGFSGFGGGPFYGTGYYGGGGLGLVLVIVLILVLLGRL